MSEVPGWVTPQPGRAPEGGQGGPGGHGGQGGPGGVSGWGPPPAPPAGPNGPAYPPWGSPAFGGGPPPAKPGVIPLRPLGISELLDGALSAVRAHPRTMLGLSALVVAVTQVLTSLVLYLALSRSALFSAPTAGASPEQLANDLVKLLSSAGSAVVVSGFAQLVLAGVLTVVVSKAVLGQGVGLGEAWRQARPRLPRLFGATLIFALLLLAAVVVPLAPGLVVLGLTATGASVGIGAAVALLLLGGLLAVAAFLYCFVIFSVVAPAVVLERQGARAALRRSRRLVSGSFWRVFGILALTQILVAIVGGALSLPFAAATFLLQGFDPQANPFELVPLTLSTLGSILGGTVTYPFAAAVTVLVYIDLRMRREGLDLALSRAAATPPPTSAGTAGPGPAAT